MMVVEASFITDIITKLGRSLIRFFDFKQMVSSNQDKQIFENWYKRPTRKITNQKKLNSTFVFVKVDSTIFLILDWDRWE